MGSSRLPNINNLVPFDLDDEQQRQFEVNERRKRQNRIAQQNFRKKRSRELAEQGSSTSTRHPQLHYERPATPSETQQDHLEEETPDLISTSLLSNDLGSSAISGQFTMPRNTFATPFSTSQSSTDFPFLPAQDQGVHLSSSSYHDQPRQAMSPHYPGLRERYTSPGPEGSLQVPYGSSMLPEHFLSAPLVQEGEAVRMMCCTSCRTVLEMFSHRQNRYGSASIKGESFPNSLGQDQSHVIAPRNNQGSSISYMTGTSTMDNRSAWQIPLHISADKGHDKCIRALLDNGADVDAVNSTGLTALHLAARNGHIDVVTTLLRHNANVDATDESGWTALHHAANNDYEAIVRLLTRRGADINAKARDRGPQQQGR